MTPEDVRVSAIKMRDLLKTIESAPLSEVVPAVEALKSEIDSLLKLALKAAGRRLLE